MAEENTTEQINQPNGIIQQEESLDLNAGQDVNTTSEQDIKPEGDSNPVNDGNVEGDTNTPEGEQTTDKKEPTVAELQNKLKEYETREEDQKLLKQRLGLDENVDNQTLDLMNIDSQIVNRGKQEYLRLCNEYGIDATPEKVQASLDELKKTDPAKGFEFERRAELLGQSIAGQRQQVQYQQFNYDVNRFVSSNNELLSSSPVLNSLVSEYIQNNYGSQTICSELQDIMEIATSIYREALDVAKKSNQIQQVKSDTSGVTGGIATINTPSYSGEVMFTREQIAKMSPSEFAKNEKAIERAYANGQIQ